MDNGEIVIRGGTVVDGTGRPGYSADVLIEDGCISAIGDRLRGQHELDASGQVVSPGFIDIHSHYDAQVFWDPWLTPSVFHGVTSVVAGNCGFSIAPTRADGVALLARTLQNVEDMSFETLRVGVPWDELGTFLEYLNAIERRGVALNFGCYVGHTAIRLFVMGDEAYERDPDPAELQQMEMQVEKALAAGALGFASSSSPTHNGDMGRPVPSRRADIEELRALLTPVRRAGKGVVALLPGERITHQDVFALQAEIGRPVTWTALVTRKGQPYHEQVVAAHQEAWRAGIDVWPQISCRPLAFEMNMEEPFILNMRRPFATLMGHNRQERIAAYRDPAWRAAAWQESLTGSPFRWHTMSVAESASRPDLVGRRIEDLVGEPGETPLDVLLDVALDDDLKTRFRCVIANDDPDGIAWLLAQDHLLLGLADSGAHVSQICDACFATDLLGNWVRERGVLPIERAIRKLTGEPAEVFGLHGRGRVEEGWKADLCVFDPATVAPGPLRRVRDFPADGERLTADAPVGMTHVLVNGVAIREDGQPLLEGLESRPGVVLRA